MNSKSKAATLTVLTDPVPYGFYFLIYLTKFIFRKLKSYINPLPHYMQSIYGGHPAVTGSLDRGLRNLSFNYNYNPKNKKDIAKTVVVLSGVGALKQAIRLKMNGQILRLFAGPNLVEFPSDYDGLITSRYVDKCITPCDWTNKLYEHISPEIKGRCVAWPAGVNVSYWKPHSEVRDTVLIYEKQRKGPVGPVEPYADWIKAQGFRVEIIKCGEYTLDEYRRILNRTLVMVGFVVDESQGLAWAEAWAMDVPTLIWENKSSSLRGLTYPSSTAPYLQPENGLFFKNIDDFKITFVTWSNNISQFRPREWVLNNMSDEVCAKQLLNLIFSEDSGIC